MTIFQIEQDMQVLSTETAYYLVEADSLNVAIELTAEGCFEAYKTKEWDNLHTEITSYKDSHEVKDEGFGVKIWSAADLP